MVKNLFMNDIFNKCATKINLPLKINPTLLGLRIACGHIVLQPTSGVLTLDASNVSIHYDNMVYVIHYDVEHDSG